MPKLHLFSFVFILALLLTSCNPAPAPAPASPTLPPAIATSVPRLETATSVPTPTAIPAAPQTAPTQQLAPSVASPTPDLRLINQDPGTFVPQLEDLPQEGRFFLPPGGRQPVHNSDLLQAYPDQAQALLDQTGRIDGWQALYVRGSEGVRSPERVTFTVTQFETPAGAQQFVQAYNPAAAAWLGQGWQTFTTTLSPTFTQQVDTFVTLRKLSSLGASKKLEQLRLDFAYRNYAISIETQQWEGDIPMDWLEARALEILAKLTAAPVDEK